MRERFEGRVEELDGVRRMPFHRGIAAALLEETAGAPRGPVLELGCATGALLDPWTRAGRTAIGLDLVPGMLQQARAHWGCPVVTADAQHLPFADGSFAAVAGIFYFQLLPEPALALAEARRVLGPGGVHAIASQRRGWDEEAAGALARRLRATPAEAAALRRLARCGPGSRRYAARDLELLMRRAGFTGVCHRPVCEGGVILVRGHRR